MIITIPRDSAMESAKANASAVFHIVNKVGMETYAGNLAYRETWAKGRRVSFTVKTHDSRAHGSRTSWSGRHGKWASWEAHRDVMRALLTVWPTASIRCGLGREGSIHYAGLASFEAQYPATGSRNVGSMAQPCTLPELTI